MPQQEKAGEHPAHGGNQVRVNSREANGIDDQASLGTPSKTIDAARTLTYDAARHSFLFCKRLKGSSAAYEVSNSLLEGRYDISFWAGSELRLAAAPAIPGKSGGDTKRSKE